MNYNQTNTWAKTVLLIAKTATPLGYAVLKGRYFPVNCKCRQEAYEKAENERKLQERKAKAEEYRRNSALGKHFRNCTFKTAMIIPSNKAVYQMCQNCNTFLWTLF